MKQEREDEAPSADNPGILYGTWWHEFVQTIAWADSASWPRRFQESQAHSPDRERSAREWELFRHSTLAGWLAEPGRLIQVEFPFLWREATGAWIEGVMDLAVFSPSDSTWHVGDWKTNRIGSGGSNTVVVIYREQIRAYVRALRDILSMEVRGSLYLTQTGEWIEIDDL